MDFDLGLLFYMWKMGLACSFKISLAWGCICIG